jgi:F0F1-type ATP synthase beta subunit
VWLFDPNSGTLQSRYSGKMAVLASEQPGLCEVEVTTADEPLLNTPGGMKFSLEFVDVESDDSDDEAPAAEEKHVDMVGLILDIIFERKTVFFASFSYNCLVRCTS